jgi:hypothetical protein
VKNTDESALSYSWVQTDGLEVTLNDATSVNPTFTAPEVTTQINLTFQLTVSKEEGTTSEPDRMTVTVSPVTTTPPPPEHPQTIYDIIKNIVKNLLDTTNSVESSHKIIDILTDGNRDNDQIACDLLVDIESNQMNRVQEIMGCQ